MEVAEELGTAAEGCLRGMGYSNIRLRIGDGSRGWAEHAPFDGIMVTAASEEIPPALLAQLGPGRRLVMPLGPGEDQHLGAAEKAPGGEPHRRRLMPVRFGRLETVVRR